MVQRSFCWAVGLLIGGLLVADGAWTIKPSDTSSPGSINRGSGTTSWSPNLNNVDENGSAISQFRFWRLSIPYMANAQFSFGDVRINRFGTGITDVIRFTRAYLPEGLPNSGRTRTHRNGLSVPEEMVYEPSMNDTTTPMGTTPMITTLGESAPMAASISVTAVGNEGFFWFTYRGNSANKVLPFTAPAGVGFSPAYPSWPTVTLGPGVLTYKPTANNQPGYISGFGDINYDFSLGPNQCSQSNGGCDSSPFGTCSCSGTGCSVPVCGCAPVSAASGFPPYMVGPWNGLQGSVCVGYQFPCSSNAGCHPTPQLYCSIIAGNIGLCRIDKCLETVCSAGKTCIRAGDSAQCV